MADTAGSPNGRIDPEFTAYPLRALADTALQRAAELGAQHADFRAERILAQRIGLSDGTPETLSDTDILGLAVRVIVDGTWGFAATVDMTPDAAARAAAEAVQVARVAAAINSERIELAGEPPHGDVSWVSAYDVDPFGASLTDKVGTAGAVELGAARARADRPRGRHAVPGSRVQVLRRRGHHRAAAADQDRPGGQLRRGRAGRAVRDDAHAAAAGRARPEYLGGSPWSGAGAWDFPAELAAMPGLLAEKLAAPSVPAGRYDLVIDPSNLWLTIHESIGHATELDRALGYEAAFAGTSFATPDKLGSLRYGSPVMHVTGDRTAEHGLASVGYDDEGVDGQSWDLITGGIFTGYQVDRRMA